MSLPPGLQPPKFKTCGSLIKGILKSQSVPAHHPSMAPVVPGVKYKLLRVECEASVCILGPSPHVAFQTVPIEIPSPIVSRHIGVFSYPCLLFPLSPFPTSSSVLSLFHISLQAHPLRKCQLSPPFPDSPPLRTVCHLLFPHQLY